MKKLKLAVIGYGGMGSYHFDHLLPHEGELFEPVGVYDIKEDRQTLATEKGLKAYGSRDELLADPEIDCILIATPNDSHKEIAIAALEAGKQVVSEKPVTMNAAEMREIMAVAEQTGQVFMVHQNRRWDPDYLIVKELMNSGAIGDVFQIESRVHGANGIPGDWRRLKQHGGGMLLDWGIHLLDQIMWMVDSPLKAIEADFSKILGEECDDGYITYLTFENGLRVITEVGTTNYIRLPRWYVKGTQGTAEVTDWDLSGKMVVATNADVAAPTPIQAGVGLTKTMAPPSEAATKTLPLPKGLQLPQSFYQNFYDVIVNDGVPIVKNEEVLKVMELIDHIFEIVEKSN